MTTDCLSETMPPRRQMSVVVNVPKKGKGDPFVPEIPYHQKYHPKGKAKQNFLKLGERNTKMPASREMRGSPRPERETR